MPNETDREIEALFRAAAAARTQAHAPYSGFRVGAAIRSESGRIHVGCNVENAAYPVGTCAEAGAIAAMVAAGDRIITAIAVAGSGRDPCMPCGACRQRIVEFVVDDAPVYCFGVELSDPHRSTAKSLLPSSFSIRPQAAASNEVER